MVVCTVRSGRLTVSRTDSHTQIDYYSLSYLDREILWWQFVDGQQYAFK